jgi:iron complex outermembrane recepter protein
MQNIHFMKQSFFFSAFLILWAASIQAQVITGRVRMSDGTPAAFSSIYFLQAADSVQIAGMLADSDGVFTSGRLTAGTYLVKAAAAGYGETWSAKLSLTETDTLHISPMILEDKALNEVVVRANLPAIDRQIDKTVVRVAGSGLAIGKNGMELLQGSPGVVVTPQGGVQLEGKGGVAIYVDGKPVQLTGDPLLAFLQSLSSEQVESIELVHRPSSKYDAGGVSGIINIRLKKNRTQGFNGSLNVGHNQAVHARTRSGGNLNYRAGKVHVFANGSILNGAQSVDQSVSRNAVGQVQTQENPLLEHFQSQSFTSGMDVFISDKHSAGWLWNGNFYQNQNWKNSVTQIGNTGETRIDSVVISDIAAPFRQGRNSLNINYHFVDTLGNDLSIEVDRIRFDHRGNNDLYNRQFTAQYQPLWQEKQRSNAQTRIDVHSFKADYTKNKDEIRLETGIKFNNTDTQNDLLGQREKDGMYQPDTSLSNRFNYQERIAAAYFNIQRQQQKWAWQLGLRAEHTRVQGRSESLSGQVLPQPDTAYLGLFPTAYLQYSPGGNHQWRASVNRRLSRPAYQDLNPFIWQTDPYTSERGNPYLRPAISWSAELSYTYKYAASLSLGYSRTDFMISTVTRQEGLQNFSQPMNLNRQDNFSLNLSMPIPINRWWEGYLWLGVWHNRFQSALPEGQLQQSAPGGGCYVSQKIQLGSGYEVEANLWAQFPTREGVARNKGIASVGASAKKTFFHGKLTCTLNVQDIFRTQQWIETIQFGQVDSRRVNTWESQSFSIGLNWNFGDNAQKNRQRKQSNGNSDTRIKSRLGE